MERMDERFHDLCINSTSTISIIEIYDNIILYNCVRKTVFFLFATENVTDVLYMARHQLW
jgi:hypothetical protein